MQCTSFLEHVTQRGQLGLVVPFRADRGGGRLKPKLKNIGGGCGRDRTRFLSILPSIWSSFLTANRGWQRKAAGRIKMYNNE